MIADLGGTGVMQRQIVEYDLDAQGALVGGPTTIDNFTAVGVLSPTAVVAGNRTLFVITVDDGAGRRLHAVQVCD